MTVVGVEDATWPGGVTGRTILEVSDGTLVGATINGDSGSAAGGGVAGFNRTNANTTKFTANNPSSAHTHDGVLSFLRRTAVGSVDGFC